MLADEQLRTTSRYNESTDMDQLEQRASQHAGPPRISVVDDEQIIATTTSIILRKAGYEAEAFFNPVTLLESVDRVAPDLIISDIVMPEMTGVDLPIRLQQTHPQCKVLLFSGQAATSVLLEEARAQGHSFEVISKPLHPTDLLQHVENVFKR